MFANQKFEQIWGFRENVDSSSDESKSNPVVGKVQEKVSSIPSLVSPENNRVNETDNQHVEVEKKPTRARNAAKTEKRNTKEVKGKPKNDSLNIKKRGNNIRKKKSKFISQMTVLDDFRVFTESILDDLRVARETMFAKMRKEMDQLMNSNPNPHASSKTRKGSKTNATKKPNQKPRARKPTKTKQKTKLPASNDLDHPQDQVKNQNPNVPSSKNPILIDSSGKKPIFTNVPSQTITSSYFTLPVVSSSGIKNSILIDSHAKKPIFTTAPDRVATPSYLTVPVVFSNGKSLKVERGSCSGVRGEERFTSYGNNYVGSSYEYPPGFNYHQRFDNCSNFGIPYQEFSHDGSVLGANLINGAGLSGNSIPNHLASSGVRSLYPN